MKAYLEFDLPEESEQYKNAIDAQEMAKAINSFRTDCITKRDELKTEAQYELLNDFRIEVEEYFGKWLT